MTPDEDPYLPLEIDVQVTQGMIDEGLEALPRSLVRKDRRVILDQVFRKMFVRMETDLRYPTGSNDSIADLV